MSVSYETIIQKMQVELQAAAKQKDNAEKVKKHVNHVRLLCDLILTRSENKQAHQSITEAEMKAMLGSKQVEEQKDKQTQPAFEETINDSIFDF